MESRSKVSQTIDKTNGAAPNLKPAEFPKFTLEQALAVPNALHRNGGQPLPPVDTAAAIERSPGSSKFRQITAASSAYGLTIGSYKADRISLGNVGRAVLSPKDPDERGDSLVQAALRPPLFAMVYDYYKGQKFPEQEFMANTVVREFGVPDTMAADFVRVFTENMRYVGLIRATTSGDWLSRDATPGAPPTAQVPEAAAQEVANVLEEAPAGLPNRASAEPQPPVTETEPERKRRPNVLFVGHGKNKKPMGQLTKTLDQMGIPYKVAQDEPHLARPISTKVHETMGECGAAILVFSADREYRDLDGEPVWLPSENVGNELGAASVLYDDRIIIFKEEGVELASNYSGIGYITFEKDKLDAKVPDLLRELVAMKILKVSVDAD